MSRRRISWRRSGQARPVIALEYAWRRWRLRNTPPFGAREFLRCSITGWPQRMHCYAVQP